MLRKFLIAAGTAALLPLSAPPAAWADAQELSADELMEQVEWLQVQMSSLLQQIEQLKSQSGDAAAKADTAAMKADDLEERTAYLEEDVEDLDDRLMGPERHTALDKIRFGGDCGRRVVLRILPHWNAP